MIHFQAWPPQAIVVSDWLISAVLDYKEDI
jgi:hypothetical protein